MNVEVGEQVEDLVLSYHVGLGDQTQVLRLGSKCLSPLSHFIVSRRLFPVLSYFRTPPSSVYRIPLTLKCGLDCHE